MGNGTGIIIRDIAVEHGSLIRDNDYFYNLYGEKAFFARNIIEDFLVRDKRYVVDTEKGENATTLAIGAAKKVIKKAGLEGKDIDMICLCTFTGESVTPPGAIKIHHAIDGKESTPCFDMNANCIGMPLAIELLSKYMSCSDEINRVLIVGSECLSLMFNPDEIVSYVMFGDAGCAVILEKTEDSSKFFDTRVYTKSSGYDLAAGPICGLSHIFNASKQELYFTNKADAVDMKQIAEVAKKIIQDHQISISDIKLFCVSQSSKTLSEEFLDVMGVEDSKRLFICEEYGYTGGNSPLIVLNEGIEQGKVKRGDYIFIWTVAAGTQNIMSLFKY